MSVVGGGTLSAGVELALFSSNVGNGEDDARCTAGEDGGGGCCNAETASAVAGETIITGDEDCDCDNGVAVICAPAVATLSAPCSSGVPGPPPMLEVRGAVPKPTK